MEATEAMTDDARRGVLRALLRVVDWIPRAIEEDGQDARGKMYAFGLLAVLGFPSYWVIWTYIWTQPYENLGLRMALAACAIPLLLARFVPAAWQSALSYYWASLIGLSLPAFFTYMWSMNGGNDIWSASLIIALVLPFFALEARVAMLINLIGVAIGACAFPLAAPQDAVVGARLDFLPVLGFAIISSVVFNMMAERQRAAQFRAAQTLGGHIAHELAGPLSNLRLAVGVLEGRVAPWRYRDHDPRRLSEALAEYPRREHEAILALPKTMRGDVDYAAHVIEYLLDNARIWHASGTKEPTSVLACIEEAKASRAFAGRLGERHCFAALEGEDFAIAVPRALMAKVISNILRNAQRAILKAGRGGAGRIEFRARVRRGFGELEIADNGAGIAPRHLAKIFEPFVTFEDGGSGLGLHFCRETLQKVGGSIRVASTLGEGTVFTLRIPLWRGAARDLPASEGGHAHSI